MQKRWKMNTYIPIDLRYKLYKMKIESGEQISTLTTLALEALYELIYRGDLSENTRKTIEEIRKRIEKINKEYLYEVDAGIV